MDQEMLKYVLTSISAINYPSLRSCLDADA